MKMILYILGISMVPIIELRGAIPIAIANGINPYLAFIISVIGNMIPVPFIILFIRKIFNLLRTKSNWLNGFVTKMELKANAKAETVRKYEALGLFILVAIPLPGTGAWTGALVAAMMDLRMRIALPMIFLGVCAAGILVSLFTMGFVSLC